MGKSQKKVPLRNAHMKFGRNWSNGLGDSVTDGRRRLQYPRRFFIIIMHSACIRLKMVVTYIMKALLSVFEQKNLSSAYY